MSPATRAELPSALLRSAHLAPSLAVTTVTTVLAVGVGLPAGRCALIAAAFLCGQLSIGWVNDAVDGERDRVTDRPGKPVAQGEVAARTVWTAAVVAVALCVPLSLAIGVRPGLLHLVAVASGWAYDLWLKSTVLSPLPYAVSFGLVPAVVWLAVPETPPVWLVVSGALLGVGAHGANVLPDLGVDAVTGVRGLPQRLGATWTRVLTAAALALAVLVLAVAPAGPVGVPGWLALAATAALLAVGAARTALAFPATIAIAGVAVVLLTVRSGGGAT